VGFGQQMGSLKNLKKSMAKGSGGAWIKYIPKNGSMNVRFIQEPEHWVNYVEHFDSTARRSFPCNGEAGCPGCAGGERKSSRYLANAVDRDNNDRVIPLQLPKDLANRLVIRYERNGTLTDRDFELSRAGDGLDTVYDLDAGPVDRAKIDKYKPLDLLKTLEDAYNEVFGDGDSDDEDDDTPAAPVKPRKRSGAAAAAKPKAEPEEDDEDEDDEEDEEPAPKPAKKTAAKKSAPKKKAAPEPEFTPEVDEDEDDEPEDDEDEPDEDEPDVDEDEDDDEGYTEDVLRAMPMGVLRKVAREEFGVATRGKDQDALIDAIFAAGEDDDD
jgi:hypothetical protein